MLGGFSWILIGQNERLSISSNTYTLVPDDIERFVFFFKFIIFENPTQQTKYRIHQLRNWWSGLEDLKDQQFQSQLQRTQHTLQQISDMPTIEHKSLCDVVCQIISIGNIETLSQRNSILAANFLVWDGTIQQTAPNVHNYLEKVGISNLDSNQINISDEEESNWPKKLYSSEAPFGKIFLQKKNS